MKPLCFGMVRGYIALFQSRCEPGVHSPTGGVHFATSDERAFPVKTERFYIDDFYPAG